MITKGRRLPNLIRSQVDPYNLLHYKTVKVKKLCFSEQIINRLAFVVEGTSGLSQSSEQLQLHKYGDSDESRIRVIADQLKNETVSYRNLTFDILVKTKNL